MSSQSYKAGTKLSSAVCHSQFMVLRAPLVELEVTCGGIAMLDSDPQDHLPMVEGEAGPSLVGKRYVDEAETLEFLCTRGGAGAVAVNGTQLAVKQSKKLPSSD